MTLFPRHCRRAALFSLGLVFSLVFMLSSNASAMCTDYVPGEVLVKYKSSAKKAKRAQIRQLVGTKFSHHLKRLDIERLKLSTNKSVVDVVHQLQKQDDVELAEPNCRRYPRRTVPNDPDFNLQWGLENTGQVMRDLMFVHSVVGTAGADVGVTEAWDTTTGSRDVVVAVIDDSLEWDHPDLAANIWVNNDEIANNSIDDDGNGYVDDVSGWDFVDGDNDTRATPTLDEDFLEGHGTLVAGVLGAVGNNALGISGVNWQVSIMPLKVAFDVASVLAAVEYAIDNGAHIVNASFGGPQFSFAESQGIRRLAEEGILLVAAAGNVNINNDKIPDYPSSLDYPNIIAVGASNPDDEITFWSQYGQTSVDVLAPGSTVRTTVTGVADTLPGNSGSSTRRYDYVAGTSFAAPFVSGIAALIKAQFPSADYSELKGRIMASVEASTPAVVSSGGRVNAADALSVSAQPVVVIQDIQVLDSSGDNDGLIDADESFTLGLTLDNVWDSANDVTAELVSLSSGLTVVSAQADYGDMAAGSRFAATFTLEAGSYSGIQRFPMRLDISDGDGYRVSRRFDLESGGLVSGDAVVETINNSAQDDYHYYHLNVPAGQPFLEVRVFSLQNGTDMDLVVSRDVFPLFEPLGYEAESGVHVSASEDSDETIRIESPLAGTYHIVVTDYERVDGAEYTLLAKSNNNPPPGGDGDGDTESGGSGALAFVGLGLLLGALCGRRLRARRR